MRIDCSENGCGGPDCSCRSCPPLPVTVMVNNGQGDGRNSLQGGGATRLMRIIREEEEEISNNDCCNSSSSSSSIGKNSDDDDDENDDGDAQSSYSSSNNNNGSSSGSSSFDDAIQALEEALPIRRGISTFYNGKSKSFTSLADAWPSSTPSIKEIAKPENAYSRKRRNLLAASLSSPKSKSRAFQLSSISTGRISKKPKTATFCFAAESEDPELNETVTRSQLNRPLMLKQNLSSLRSFSMVNLHQCSSSLALSSTKIKNC